VGDPPVGDSGGEHGDVGGKRRAHGLQHVLRRFDIDDLDPG
jgi:hypothetical protein